MNAHTLGGRERERERGMNVSCTVRVYSVRDPAQSVTAVLASVHHQDDLLGLFLGVNLRLLLFKARESPRSAASRLNGEDFMYLFIFFGGKEGEIPAPWS